jgi:hypothetical protein
MTITELQSIVGDGFQTALGGVSGEALVRAIWTPGSSADSMRRRARAARARVTASGAACERLIGSTFCVFGVTL